MRMRQALLTTYDDGQGRKDDRDVVVLVLLLEVVVVMVVMMWDFDGKCCDFDACVCARGGEEQMTTDDGEDDHDHVDERGR